MYIWTARVYCRLAGTDAFGRRARSLARLLVQRFGPRGDPRRVVTVARELPATISKFSSQQRVLYVRVRFQIIGNV